MGWNTFRKACAKLLHDLPGQFTAQAKYNEIEVPETIKRLIIAINDGAASAQRVLVLFALLGLYLIATVFSTSDYDLLIGASKPIAQLDVQVPIVVSFAVAPVLFVLAHAFALTRYELLSLELEDFKKELSKFTKKFANQSEVKKDLERHCRELLSNIEFIEVFLGNPQSHNKLAGHQQNRLTPLLAWGILIIFPFFVLYITVIGTLRLQNILVTRLQQAACMGDILLMIWFLLRVRYGQKISESTTTSKKSADTHPQPTPNASRRFKNAVLTKYIQPYFYPGLTFAVLIFPMLYWAEIPRPPSPSTVLSPNTVELGRKQRDHSPVNIEWSSFFRQPLDLVLCPWTHWGCRYLDLDKRIIAAPNFSTGASMTSATLSTYATGQDTYARRRDASPSAVSSANLSERTLRYADFDGADAPRTMFWHSDLRGATFERARMPGADFGQAKLQYAALKHAYMGYATFRNAQLQGADLSDADFEGADLRKANFSYDQIFKTDLDGTNLQHATLVAATMFGASLRLAKLSDADLTFAFPAGADLSGADLRDAKLTGAYLMGATMFGTDLRDAELAAADLRNTRMAAADLAGAELEGSLLANAQLRATDLSNARLFGSISNRYTDISFADVGGLDTVSPLPPEKNQEFEKGLEAVKSYRNFVAVIKKRVDTASKAATSYSPLRLAFAKHSVFAEPSSILSFPELDPDALIGPTSCLGPWIEQGSAWNDTGINKPKQWHAGGFRITYDREIFGDFVRPPRECALRDKSRRRNGRFIIGPSNEKPSPNHMLSLWVGLAKRASDEGSDDDPDRGAAFACADLALMRGPPQTNPPGSTEHARLASRISIVTSNAIVAASGAIVASSAASSQAASYPKAADLDKRIKTVSHAGKDDFVVIWLDNKLPQLMAKCPKETLDRFQSRQKPPSPVRGTGASAREIPAAANQGEPGRKRRMSQRANATVPAARPPQAAAPPSSRSDPPPTAQTLSHR